MQVRSARPETTRGRPHCAGGAGRLFHWPVVGDDARIRRYLGAVRRRLRARQLAAELTLALALSGPCLFGLLWVAAGASPGPLWRVLGGLTGGGALLLAAIAVGRALRRFRHDEPVARLVGERTGEGDFLLSAVELSRALPELVARPELGSPELARAHLAEAARRITAQGASPAQVAPWLPPRNRLIAAGLVAALYIGALAASQQRLSRGLHTLLGRTAQSAPRSTEPLVGDIELRLEFPPHTALPPRVIPGSSGEVLAPPGTRVTVRARPLVAIKGAHLELEDAAGQVTSQIAVSYTGGALEARFDVARTGGGYRFVLERSALQSKGLPRALREPESHRIEVESDRAPKVTLVAPAEDLDLETPRPIELAWSAEDDYGLGDVELVWKGAGDSGAGGRIEGRKLVRRSEPGQSAPEGGKAASGMIEWDVGELNLPPGVRITYHVEARDIDAVSGPNVGSSRSFTLRIYSPVERHDELLAAEQALVDHAVELLGDRLEAGRGAPAGDALARVLGGAHRRTEDFLGELSRLRGLLDKDPMAPRDLKPALAGISSRIGKLQHGEKGPLEALTRSPGDPSARGGAEAASARHVAELEKDVILLDDLIGRQRIEQLLAVTDQMQQTRDRLRSLLAEYKRTGSDEVRRDIEREIRALEQKMAELAAKAAKLAGEVPDEFVNREALGDNDMQKRLDAIRDLVKKGEVDKAMEEMRKLSATLDRMVQSLEGDLKGFRGDRFSSEERALAELESKLSDLEHDEREILQETEQVRGRQRDEQKRIGRERMEPFLKRAREKAAEARRRLAAIERNEVPPEQQEDLDRVRHRVDDLQRALEHGDLEQAGEVARNAAALLHGLSFMLRDEEERRWTGARAGIKRSRERVDEAEPMVRQIGEELDQLMPRPGELLGEAERRRLEQLAQRQDAVRKRTDELLRELERRSGAPPRAAAGSAQPGPQGEPMPGQQGQQGQQGQAPGPMPGQGPQAGLKTAGEHMGRAGDALRAGNPRDGSGEEGQAAEQLARMRRDIQNERRPRNEGGAGGMASKEPVRIPGAEEFRAPREFRQDLLEAMKREAPERYRKQVKRYYEELVK